MTVYAEKIKLRDWVQRTLSVESKHELEKVEKFWRGVCGIVDF